VTYKLVRIPKGNGGVRRIFIPDARTKRFQRSAIPGLEALALKVCPKNVVHGFWPCRNCVTNAQQHVGYRYTVSMDLKDFFDSCTFEKFRTALHLDDEDSLKSMLACIAIRSNCFHSDVARQGLPSSPAIANICAAPMDHAILDALPFALYTRYADDLTLSCNCLTVAKRIMDVVPAIAEKYEFEVNPRKTKLQWSGAGRRIITGVAVDDDGVHPTRKTRRLVRAAIYKSRLTGKLRHVRRAQGLAEWAECKPPNIGKKAKLQAAKEPQDAFRIALEAARFA